MLTAVELYRNAVGLPSVRRCGCILGAGAGERSEVKGGRCFDGSYSERASVCVCASLRGGFCLGLCVVVFVVILCGCNGL